MLQNDIDFLFTELFLIFLFPPLTPSVFSLRFLKKCLFAYFQVTESIDFSRLGVDTPNCLRSIHQSFFSPLNVMFMSRRRGKKKERKEMTFVGGILLL